MGEGPLRVKSDTTIVRTGLAQRKKLETFDGVEVYYLSFDEALVFDKQTQSAVTFSADTLTMTLKKGAYHVKYIILPQKQILKDDKVLGAEVVNPELEKKSKCYVKFEDEKIWVNPYLENNFDDSGIIYYQLSNRQTVTFRFTEIATSAFTLPFKYRPKHKGYGEDFSTAINFNILVGITPFPWGWTSHHYRAKVGSVTTTHKLTLGALFGVSTVALDAGNTSASTDPVKAGDKITKGLVTFGGGLVYSRNKLSFGLLTGVDWAAGDNANRWNYNGDHWAGLAIGYAIFPFTQ